MRSQRSSAFGTDALGSHLGSVTCEPNWNLISFPGGISQAVGQVLQDRASDSLLFTALWGWNSRQNRFQRVLESSVPEPNIGFWLYSDTGGQPRAYDIISQTAGIDLQDGWNLIGPSAEISISNNSSVVAAWRWSATERTYRMVSFAERLLPGYAYWVYSRSHNRLTW